MRLLTTTNRIACGILPVAKVGSVLMFHIDLFKRKPGSAMQVLSDTHFGVRRAKFDCTRVDRDSPLVLRTKPTFRVWLKGLQFAGAMRGESVEGGRLI